MAPFNKPSNINPNTKKFVYFVAENLGNKHQTFHEEKNAADDLLDKMLKVIGREVLREKTPTIQDLERSLQDISARQNNMNKETVQEIRRLEDRKQISRETEYRFPGLLLLRS